MQKTGDHCLPLPSTCIPRPSGRIPAGRSVAQVPLQQSGMHNSASTTGGTDGGTLNYKVPLLL